MNLACVFLMSLVAHARVPNQITDFVTLSSGRQIWVERRPAAPGRPTIMMVNGLTYTTREWDDQVNALLELDPGLGVQRFDSRGMGRSASNRYEDITFDDQVKDLVDLKRRSNLTGPVFLLGLSYGGGETLKTAAEYPGDFDGFIAMAPFLKAHADAYRMIETWVRQHRAWFPLDPRSDEGLDDHYLRTLVYLTYGGAEPTVMRDFPRKIENIFRLVKGSRTWDATSTVGRWPAGRVHLMFAEEDEAVPIRESRAFADALPAGLAASVLYMKNVRHKIPEVAPRLAAKWILRIVHGDPELRRGLTYAVDGARPSRCETVLGRSP